MNNGARGKPNWEQNEQTLRILQNRAPSKPAGARSYQHQNQHVATPLVLKFSRQRADQRGPSDKGPRPQRRGAQRCQFAEPYPADWGRRGFDGALEVTSEPQVPVSRRRRLYRKDEAAEVCQEARHQG